MDKPEIEERIYSAIDKLFEVDGELLKIDANERTITHRLAIYLEELFPEWNVDCEYNRLFDDVKRTILTKKILYNVDGVTPITDENAHTVFPDNIIHRRNTEDNLVVIEVKKTTNPKPDKDDLAKLHAYQEQLKYVHTVFIRFKTGEKEIGIERIEVQ